MNIGVDILKITRGILLGSFMCVIAYQPLFATEVVLSFKDSAVVNDSLIHLFDIASINVKGTFSAFDINTFVAGNAAPPGFSRLINISDLVMYRLHTSFKDCQLTVNGKPRITVFTKARSFSVKSFYPELKSYLDSVLKWNAKDWEVNITNDTCTWKGFDAQYSISFKGIQSGYEKGRVNLNALFLQGSRTLTIPLHCVITVKTDVVIASRDIQRGEELSTDNCQVSVLDITNFAPQAFTGYKQLAGTQSSMTVKAGTILQRRMVSMTPDIIKGENVEIIYKKGKVICTIQGTAREAGVKGDVIWVESGASQRLVRAKITGKGTVELV